jgi:hypothetical protein
MLFLSRSWLLSIKIFTIGIFAASIIFKNDNSVKMCLIWSKCGLKNILLYVRIPTRFFLCMSTQMWRSKTKLKQERLKTSISKKMSCLELYNPLSTQTALSLRFWYLFHSISFLKMVCWR